MIHLHLNGVDRGVRDELERLVRDGAAVDDERLLDISPGFATIERRRKARRRNGGAR